MLRKVYFGLIPKLEILLLLAALPFLAEVCYGFVAGVWEAELLVARAQAGLYRTCEGDEVDKHCAQFFVNSSLSPVLLFRRRSQVCCGCSEEVFGVKGLLSLGGMLC